MVARLEIALKEDFVDPEALSVVRKARDYFGYELDYVDVVDVLTLDSDLSTTQLERIRTGIFTNPVTQVSSFKPLERAGDVREDPAFDFAIHISYKPGVMDPKGLTAVEAIEDSLRTKFKPGEGAYTSKLYFLKGDISAENAERIAREMLANDAIERWRVIPYSDWDFEKGIGLDVPKVVLPKKTIDEMVQVFPHLTHSSLLDLSKKRSLALNDADIPTILGYFTDPGVKEEREKYGLTGPTDIELEYIAQARSDHCNHNTFNGRFNYTDLSTGKTLVIENLFDKTIKQPTLKIKQESPWVISVLWDNCGIARFDDQHNYTISAETHNSPTNMEAYGGAITGNVGEYRDKMGGGLGSRVFMGLYGFCFPPLDLAFKNPKQGSRKLREGAIRGIKDGANKSGVHTPFGLLVIDPSYAGKCNLFAGSIGIMPAEVKGKPSHEKHIDDGDICFMVGGRVGIDGIHGVTAASEEFTDSTPSGHVQIGFPYGQKKMEGFLMEARDSGLIKYITDNGGGGLSSSVGESARECGEKGGVNVRLDKVPTKYAGLDPWQIWVSESQERMTVAVDPKHFGDFVQLAKKHDVEATEIGIFNDTGKLHIEYQGETVAHVDLSLLKQDFPQWEFDAEWIPPELRLQEPVISNPKDMGSCLEDMLARDNICSREWIVRQYDHEVQGGSVVKPLVGINSDVHSGAVVSRPVLDSERGLAVTQVINPWFSKIDTYHMAAYVADEAIRKVVAVGGNPDEIGFVDNFCWPNIQHDPETNPDGKYKAAQLVRACKAVKEIWQEAFGRPLLSGKDSMYIDGNVENSNGLTKKVSGLPTLQCTASTVVEDVSKCVTMDAKIVGDLVYVLGVTKDELGGSEFYAMHGETGLNVPKVTPQDAKKSAHMYQDLAKAIQKGIVASAHAVSRGGLGVELAKVAFAGDFGMDIDLGKVATSFTDVYSPEKINSMILFSESAGRFIVTIDPRNKARFERNMAEHFYSCIGKVSGNKTFKVRGVDDLPIIEKQVAYLKAAYKKHFGDLI